jgi:hypothetical protein
MSKWTVGFMDLNRGDEGLWVAEAEIVNAGCVRSMLSIDFTKRH